MYFISIMTTKGLFLAGVEGTHEKIPTLGH